ncbi:hypothetical protein [uncultured Flavonifractor sp.]|uniref:hypothetical protein n=1 Tax=uncultured Flavonifractor sp. TaxID=1193534 RepID=UPI002599CF40|nr:hypothetical protein [uncultured Flavonifractor sp.]
MSKQLLIAIDPGFDAMKVIANGVHFKFPFSAVETDERKMSDYGSRQGFILYKDSSGATWRVGQYARTLMFENKSQQEDSTAKLYTEERFVSPEAAVGILSAIARAIDLTGLYEEQQNLDIRLIVALPHAVRNKYASTIVGLVSGEQRFYMTFDSEPERAYRFTIKEPNVMTVSQTIAAILGETSDDNGYINAAKYCYLANGPTLVIDGGYYTVGLVPVSRGGSVDDDRAESNTNYAMKNVNLGVAREIADSRPDIKHYAVEYLLSQGEREIRYMDKNEGKVVRVDLSAIRERKLQSVCGNFIRYLNKKYDNLIDFRYILVTGGTGASFFQQMLDYYKGTGLMDEEHMLLAKPVVAGKELPIEFAVAVGAYKGLRGKIGQK